MVPGWLRLQYKKSLSCTQNLIQPHASTTTSNLTGALEFEGMWKEVFFYLFYCLFSNWMLQSWKYNLSMNYMHACNICNEPEHS